MAVVLDTGALIALDRGDAEMWKRYVRATRAAEPMLTHGGVLGQAWRTGGPRQARLARALAGVRIEPLDARLGRRAGELLRAARSRDVVDAALVLLARNGDTVFTSDVDDLATLAEAARIDVDLVAV